MTNDQNIVRARHVESLAADLSDFVTQSNDELHQAVQAELADLTPAETSDDTQVVLSSDSSNVDGTLWLEDVTNSAPIVKLYHGGNVYDFPTTPDFTVIDHSAKNVGQKFTVTSSVTSVVGSMYNDTISVSGSNNRIVANAGNNRISITGGNCTFISGAGNDQVYLKNDSGHHFMYLNQGKPRIFCSSSYCTIIGDSSAVRSNVIFWSTSNHNYCRFENESDGNASIDGSMNTVVCCSPQCGIDLSDGSENIVICEGGNNFISAGSSSARLNYIDLKSGGNTIDGEGHVSTTIYSGAGNNYFYGGDDAGNVLKCKICHFSNTDTLDLGGYVGNWVSSLNSSTILITAGGGGSDSVITLQDYTATQFHINGVGGTADVYTIQGSALVPAGS